MYDDVRNDPLYSSWARYMTQLLLQDPAVSLEIRQYFREDEQLVRDREAKREQLQREFAEARETRKKEAEWRIERQIDDELSTAEKAMDLDFDKRQKILAESYRARWPLAQGDSRHDVISMGHNYPEQFPLHLQAGALELYPLLVLESSGLPQSHADFPSEDFVNWDAELRTPSPSPPTVGSRTLAASSSALPNNFSPSASTLKDSGYESGDGTCNVSLPRLGGS
jgi:hypothetical protein